MYKKFKEWITLKEAPTPDSTILGQGQPSAVAQAPVQNPSIPLQYQSQLNNRTRLPVLMQSIMGAYNNLPPDRRLDTFNREFATLKQKITASMMAAQQQLQQQQMQQQQQRPQMQQMQPQTSPQLPQTGVAPQR